MFTLEIETGNAAFETDAPRAIAGMLRVAADILTAHVDTDAPAYFSLRDENGNGCGAFYYRPIMAGDMCAVDGCGADAVTECRVNGELHNVCARHGAPCVHCGLTAVNCECYEFSHRMFFLTEKPARGASARFTSFRNGDTRNAQPRGKGEK